jgi:hypothetical protein
MRLQGTSDRGRLIAALLLLVAIVAVVVAYLYLFTPIL